MRGRLRTTSLANAQAVLEMSCGDKWIQGGIAAAAIADIRGSWDTGIAENAHAVFARFCGSN